MCVNWSVLRNCDDVRVRRTTERKVLKSFSRNFEDPRAYGYCTTVCTLYTPSTIISVKKPCCTERKMTHGHTFKTWRRDDGQPLFTNEPCMCHTSFWWSDRFQILQRTTDIFIGHYFHAHSAAAFTFKASLRWKRSLSGGKKYAIPPLKNRTLEKGHHSEFLLFSFR